MILCNEWITVGFVNKTIEVDSVLSLNNKYMHIMIQIVDIVTLINVIIEAVSVQVVDKLICPSNKDSDKSLTIV